MSVLVLSSLLKDFSNNHLDKWQQPPKSLFKWKMHLWFFSALSSTSAHTSLGTLVTLVNSSGKCRKTSETSPTYVGIEICAIMSCSLQMAIKAYVNIREIAKQKFG